MKFIDKITAFDNFIVQWGNLAAFFCKSAPQLNVVYNRQTSTVLIGLCFILRTREMFVMSTELREFSKSESVDALIDLQMYGSFRVKT